MEKGIELNKRIQFNCKNCNKAIMASIFPTDINLNDVDDMKSFCEFLNEGYIPIVQSVENPLQWCKCIK